MGDSFQFARRTAFIGVGGIAIAGFLGGRAFAAPMAPVGLFPDAFDVFISPTMVQPMPRTLGLEVSGEMGDVVLAVIADTDLYELATRSTIASERTRTEGLVREVGSQGITVETEAELPERILRDGNAEVIVGSRKVNWPPRDVAVGADAPEAEVRDKSGNISRVMAFDQVPVRAWGVELACQWRELRWAARCRTFIPVQIVVKSVGPFETPLELFIHVRLDGVVVPDIERVDMIDAPNGVRVARTSRIGGGWVITLRGTIAVGESVRLGLQVIAATPGRELDRFEAPQVDVRAAQADRGQRLTGRESAIRLDSAYNASTIREWTPE